MEIWEVTTELWTLPVGVEWKDEHMGEVELGAGIPLLNRQRDVLDHAIRAFGWEANGNLFINKNTLSQIGHQSLHADPENIVRWSPNRFIVHEDRGETTDQLEFLQGLADTGAMTLELAQTYWNIVRKHMLQWILVEGRSLDLRFCRLECRPFRSNWKDLMRGYIGVKSPKELLGSEEMKNKVARNMLRPEMVYYSKSDGLIYYSIDVKHQQWFWTSVQQFEQLRKKVHGKDYWHSVLNRMKEAIPDAFRSFIYYLQEIRHPIPFTSAGGIGGDPGLPQNWSQLEGELQEILETDFVPDAIDRSTGDVQERCVQDLGKAQEGVPRVPDI